MGRFEWFNTDHQWSRYWSNGAEQIADALKRAPDMGPGEIRTLSDMSENEIAELEKRYGCQVKPPDDGPE